MGEGPGKKRKPGGRLILKKSYLAPERQKAVQGGKKPTQRKGTLKCGGFLDNLD